VSGPQFDLRPVSLADVKHLFERFHAYKSTGRLATYAYAVFEQGILGERAVAAFVWQPPPPGAAKSVCPTCPQGVLALSRMVAVPPDERTLKHIAKPLRWQMRNLIDRTRWPVLVTYSDESVGHTGHVYKCSGWTPTTRSHNRTATLDGRRVSTYSNGGSADHGDDVVMGHAWLQRWESRPHASDHAAALGLAENAPGHLDDGQCARLFESRWRRVATGRKWKSGSPAYRYEAY